MSIRAKILLQFVHTYKISSVLVVSYGSLNIDIFVESSMYRKFKMRNQFADNDMLEYNILSYNSYLKAQPDHLTQKFEKITSIN